MRMLNCIASTVQACMTVPRALQWAILTAFFLGFTAVLALVFWWLDWNWTVYGGIIGAQFGFAVGIVVLVRIAPKVQLAGVGAIAGMGVDQIVGAASRSDSVTAITALAGVVSNTIHSAPTATQQTGIPSPSQLPLSVGLWIFFVVLGVMMMFGSLEPDAK